MVDAKAIQEIAAMAKADVKDIGNHQFFIGTEGATALKYPKGQALTVFGLSQLLNFVKVSMESGVINVLSETRVQFIKTGRDENNEIDVMCEADFSKMYKSFPFGNQLSQEDFVIELMTKFEKDEVRDALLKLVSTISKGKVTESDDDGFSQQASMKAGVTLVMTEKIQNFWELHTYKTFPEVDQPIIPYILRLHQRVTSEDMPKFALYDCDGGAWRVGTAGKVRDYCQKFINDNSLGSKVQVL